MTEVQFTIGGLAVLSGVSVAVNWLNKKYQNAKRADSRGIQFKNDATFTNVSPGGFMLNIPFLILYRSNTKSLRLIILLHNLLAFLFYLLLAAMIYFDCTRYS